MRSRLWSKKCLTVCTATGLFSLKFLAILNASASPSLFVGRTLLTNPSRRASSASKFLPVIATSLTQVYDPTTLGRRARIPISEAIPMSTSLTENIVSLEQIRISAAVQKSAAAPSTKPCRTQITAVWTVCCQHDSAVKRGSNQGRGFIRFWHFSILVIQSWNSAPNRLRSAARLAGSTCSFGRGINGEPSLDTHLRSMPTENALSPDPEKTTARTEGFVESWSKIVRSSSHSLNQVRIPVVTKS